MQDGYCFASLVVKCGVNLRVATKWSAASNRLNMVVVHRNIKKDLTTESYVRS